MRTRSLVLVFALWALGALGACSVSEKHPSGDIDGGDIDAMPADASVDVSGTSMLTHYVRNGDSVVTMTAPEDLSIYAFAAYVPDANDPTGFRIINGAGNAQGQLTIPDVPMGPYYLRVLLSGTSAPTFYYTDDRALELGFGTAGRPGLPDVALPSAINPTITGIDRTWDSDFFSLHSLGTGTEHYPIQFSSGPPLGVRPSLTSSFEWTGGYGWALPRMRPKLLQNDDVEILHHHETFTNLPAQNRSADTLIEIARMTGLTQTDGSPLAVTGVFVDVLQNQTVTVNFQMDVLRQAYAGAPHVQEIISAGLGVLLGTDPNNRFGPGLVGVNYSLVKSSTQTLGEMLSYGNPYDNTWALVATESYLRRRRVRMPGIAANQPGNNINVGVSTTRSYTTGSIGTMVQVGPPTNLRVGGTTAADGVRAFDGIAPVRVEWSAVTNASRYSVSVRRLVTQVQFSANPSTVATVITTETSATIPASVFAPGERYVFVVSAIRDGLQYANGRLRAEVVPSFQTSQATGVILMSNLCGNGTREGAEECDTSGQSATCDVDCTLPVCFDGVLNTAANEQCDPGITTGTCDNDCTLATCGDGRLNVIAGEQCDDSNTADSDGCDHNCQFENSCGDGMVQPLYGENCDDQNAVSTDACINCHAAECGDGFVQTGVEMCDDGNLINGDGCSDQCAPD
jgi:cysteine-rich repeat protein